MNLDDRMRAAHQRQLHDVANTVDQTPFVSPSESPIRRAVPAFALVAVAILAFVGARTLTSNGDVVVESTDQPSEQAPTPSTVESATDDVVDTTTTPPTTLATTTMAPPEESPEPTVTTTAAPPETSAIESDTTSADSDESASVQTTAPVDAGVPATEPQPTAPPTTLPPVIAEGVESIKCPSGQRARLENANLVYIGENQGWNRLDDLVDEQDAEFEFEAWEPGFPDPVTVEVVLDELISAVDVRVSQDPFTPVSGNIELEVFRGDEILDSFTIALDGMGGWREHTFSEPTLFDRFRITRRVETANIVEVLVCVE